MLIYVIKTYKRKTVFFGIKAAGGNFAVKWSDQLFTVMCTLCLVPFILPIKRISNTLFILCFNRFLRD